MRSFCLFILCTLIFCAARSQERVDLSADDALIAWVSPSGRTHFSYQLENSTDLDDVAGTFGCSTDDLLVLNPRFAVRVPQRGELIEIPLASQKISNTYRIHARQFPVYYVVRPKETLFTIARRYFDITVDQVRQLNHLTANSLSIGQQLLLGYVAVRPAVEVPPLASVTDSMDNRLLPDPFADAKAIEKETGVALWNKDHPEIHHLFVMHRTARINSMLEITNPMFGRSLLVKVVGKIPRTFSDDIAIVVSPGVAQKLGAIDSRFYVQLRYVE